ncbi:MAG: hypothetical protein ACLQUY_01605 [Ktedonobacterales bacterium]
MKTKTAQLGWSEGRRHPAPAGAASPGPPRSNDGAVSDVAPRSTRHPEHH